MHFIDWFLFGLYMVGVLGIGFYFFKKNKDREDYYVGGRNMTPGHVGLSVVATDVGGGFSIGLGGLGYLMGLSGTWLLFTGLLGAWLSAVWIIPRIKKLDAKHSMLTYPDFLRFRYDSKVALVAAIISGIGYLGFTGGQVLAGAKLFSAAILDGPVLGISALTFSIILIGGVILLYTVLGGLKAVIYTDTVQWIILLVGLIFLAIPFAVARVGGFSAIYHKLPDGYFSLTAVTFPTFFNWMVTIMPIWLIGMTLYQRMYACGSTKDAQKAWFIAGIFEYPIMAFVGVFLGMCSRLLFPAVDPEMGVPLLIHDVLPIAAKGVVLASYFSAIMSTADSCLMASSGNFVNDIVERAVRRTLSEKALMRLSQFSTLIIGILAMLLASGFQQVLDAILYAYSFMVSGLFVPTLGAYFWKRASSLAAFWSMISGGSLTLILTLKGFKLAGLDPTIFGITLSALVFVTLTLLFPSEKTIEETEHSHA
jgi:solute:Na+ symporter, SSS family